MLLNNIATVDQLVFNDFTLVHADYPPADGVDNISVVGGQNHGRSQFIDFQKVMFPEKIFWGLKSASYAVAGFRS